MSAKQELKKAVKANRAAERERERARQRLYEAIIKAQQSRDLSMTEVSAIVGWSRQSVYKLLREMNGS